MSGLMLRRACQLAPKARYLQRTTLSRGFRTAIKGKDMLNKELRGKLDETLMAKDNTNDVEQNVGP